MNDYEIGWISALIDSEGSLYWQRKPKISPYPVIEIANTNLFILAKARQLLGGFITEHSRQFSVKTCFRLTISPSDWKVWLPQIVLIEKEARRQEFLKWVVSK